MTLCQHSREEELNPYFKHECLCLHVRHTHFTSCPERKDDQTCSFKSFSILPKNPGVLQHTRVSEKSIVDTPKIVIPPNAVPERKWADNGITRWVRTESVKAIAWACLAIRLCANDYSFNSSRTIWIWVPATNALYSTYVCCETLQIIRENYQSSTCGHHRFHSFPENPRSTMYAYYW